MVALGTGTDGGCKQTSVWQCAQDHLSSVIDEPITQVTDLLLGPIYLNLYSQSSVSLKFGFTENMIPWPEEILPAIRSDNDLFSNLR